MNKKYKPYRPETIKKKADIRRLSLNKAKSIIKFCSKYYGFDVTTDSRKRIYTNSRFITMKMINDYTNLSLEDIGLLFGKHHATILYSLDTIKIVVQYDKELKEQYDYFKNHFDNRYGLFNKNEEIKKSIAIFDIVKILEETDLNDIISIKDKLCLTRSEMIL